MNGNVNFDDVTNRIDAMGKFSLALAQAREADANARLTHAKATGVEFQIAAAARFLRKVEDESRRLRRAASEARTQASRLKQQWRSARVLFKGRRITTYALREAHLVKIFQLVMAETAADAFELKISAASRKGSANFVANDESEVIVPDAPATVTTVPELIQHAFDHRLIFKPLAPAMAGVAKMFKVIGAFHKAETERLTTLSNDLSKGALDIWDDIPIFGRVTEE